MPDALPGEEPIARLEGGNHPRELRRVWVMAVDAVVARPRPFSAIPVAGHAAVNAVFIVPRLRSVALGAERHDVGVFEPTPVRQPQGVVVAWVVA